MEIKWSKIFDWSVVGIQYPYEISVEGLPYAYAVDVMYRHHGLRRVIFPFGRDRMYVTGKEFALEIAKQFAEKMHKKMRQCQIKMRNQRLTKTK